MNYCRSNERTAGILVQSSENMHVMQYIRDLCDAIYLRLSFGG